ncbi:hypothetical protein AX766_04810 [Flavobacterium covae]|nr:MULTISPECIES: hypothetical protein [Flavobacterium]AMA48070.1 hypothetical protein AWN65_00645 [Flavobacterium covae]AND63784.1 hypothetical protein AX766_04810 [Flavobacterium covae]MCH4829979.1 hypothetical protein [Flavobacterium columnare]MCH4832641.1 hypothetical protein [Flavobacterium columnare]OWP80073.1 hypothetical protein BWK63_12950 [Flavobacterium covae]
MKKIKYFIMLILAVIISGILWFFYQTSTSSKRQKKDISKCVNTSVITDKPSFCIKNNTAKNINELKIVLLRDNKVIDSVTLKTGVKNKNGYFIFNIPFNQFLKTDIVEVFEREKLYKISGFGYSSDGGHWGMFGYLGDANCCFDYSNIKINGITYKGIE